MRIHLLSDEDLLDLVRSGDEAAFSEIYYRYWKKLLTVAINKSDGNVEDAEEIVQDIFVSLWKRRDQLELTSTLDNYLAVSVKYRVIKNMARRNLRHRYEAERRHLFSIADDTTQNWLEFEEIKHRLEALVTALPEKCQLVYRMSREDGYSQKQIAGELGISEKTVEAHLGKALKSLRNGLLSIRLLFCSLNFSDR